jgi:ribosome-associated protein
MAPPRRVTIRTPAIELGALLKWGGLAATGGEAKGLIQQGRVTVNGLVERRRRRTLVPGDRVEVGGRAVLIEGEAS